jgi:hypothetical protein
LRIYIIGLKGDNKAIGIARAEKEEGLHHQKGDHHTIASISPIGQYLSYLQLNQYLGREVCSGERPKFSDDIPLSRSINCHRALLGILGFLLREHFEVGFHPQSRLAFDLPGDLGLEKLRQQDQMRSQKQSATGRRN